MVENTRSTSDNGFLNKSLSQSAVYAIGNISVAFIGFIALPILTRLLGLDIYGQYVIIYQVVFTFSTLATGWASTSYLRYFASISDKKKIISTHFWGVIAGAIMLCVPAISFTIFLFSWEKITIDAYTLGWIVVLLLGFSLFQYYLSVARTQRKSVWYSFGNITHAFVRFLGGALLIFFLNKSSLSIMVISWGFALLILDILFTWRFVWQDFSLTIDFDIFRKSLIFGFPLAINLLLSSLLDTGDRFLLQLLRNSSEVALYDAAYRLAKYPLTLVGSSFMLAAYPMFVNTWDKYGKANTEIEVSKLIRYIIILMTPIVIGIAILSKEIVSIILDASFEPGYIAMPFVSIGVLFVLLSQYSTMVFLFLEKTVNYALINLCGVVINLVLNIWLIGEFGFLGAAVSTTISYIIFFIVTKVITRKYLNWHVPLNTLTKIGIAGIAMAFFLIASKQMYFETNIFMVAILFTIAFLLYLLILFVSKELSIEETQLIWKPIHERVFRLNGKK